MSIGRGTVTTHTEVWDVATMNWIAWDGSVTGGGGGGGGGATTIADGADVAEGITTDAAVVTDAAGTVSGKLRGLVKMFASAWDSANGAFRTKAATITVTDTFANGAAAGFLMIDTTGMSVVNLLWTNVVGAFNGSGITEGSPDGVNWVPAPGMMLTSTSGFHSVYAERTFYAGSDLYDMNVPVAQFKAFRLKIAGPATIGSASLCLRASAYAPPVYQPIARIAGANGDLANVDASARLSTVAAQGPSLNAPSAWYTQLTDTTNGPVAVKAASTAAVATDAALVVALSPNNVPVLPSGAATSALQTSGNTSVASIDTKTPALGQAAMAASSPVAIASDQSDLKIANGAVAQVTGTLLTDTLNNAVTITGLAGYGSVFARLQGNGGLGGPVGIAREATIDGTNWFAVGSFLVQGTQNGAITFGTRSSAAVLYPSNDAWYEVIPVGYGITGVRYRTSSTIAAGSTASVRFAANAATIPFAITANIIGTPTVTSNQGTAGTNAAAWWTRLGDATNGPVAVKAASTAAATTDPALVVRSVQLPAAVGQTTMAASLPVVLASDQASIPVTNTNLDVALSTRLKPADTLAGVTTVAAVTSITNPVAVTGPLTDTQLRATPVPVSGTVTANAGTNLNTSALALDATLTGRFPAAAAAADGLANPTITQIGADAMLFNGTSWDRAHGNWRTTTGDTGAKTVTFAGAAQTNFDSLGAWITVQLGTVSGTTPTLSCQLQYSFDAGTTWINFGAALANLTATNNTGVIIVYPANISQAAGATPANLTSGATATMAINAPLPRTWRINYTIGGTTPSFAITAVHVNYQR